MYRRGVVWLGVAVVLGLGGCEDPSGISGAATLDLAADRVVVVAGERLTLDMEGMDRGRVLGPGDVSWASSDPTTARVQDGVVTGVAPGVATVYAVAGGARDSVRVRVRLGDLGRGEVAARVQGVAGADADRFRGLASVSESTIGAFEPISLITQEDSAPGSPGTGQVQIHVPGRLEVGTTHLGPMGVTDVFGNAVITTASAGGVALYRPVGTGPVRYEVWLGVENPELEIEAVDYGPGLAEGRVLGNVSFEAAGLLMEVVDGVQRVAGPLSDTTVRVYAEFDLPLWRTATGGGTQSAQGPFGNGSTIMTGQAMVTQGGVLANLGGLMPPVTAGQPAGYVAFLQAWLPAPGVGEVALPPSAGEILGPDGTMAVVPWMWARMSAVNVPAPAPPPEMAVSRGGTMTVTGYTPPTETARGVVELSYRVELEVWDGAALTGTMVTLAGDLSLPLYPADWPGGRGGPGS